MTKDELRTKAGRDLFGALIAMTGDRDHRSYFDQVKAIEDELERALIEVGRDEETLREADRAASMAHDFREFIPAGDQRGEFDRAIWRIHNILRGQS